MILQKMDTQARYQVADTDDITITQNLPDAQWRRFVENHPDGNIFHTPDLFQVFANTKGYRPKLWAATQGEQILALFLPVEVSLFAGLPRPFATRSVIYGGILSSANDCGQKALSQLIRKYQEETKHRVLFTEVRNLAETCGIQTAIQKAGFEFEDHNDYIVGLAMPLEQVWGNIHKSTRKEIRKAQRKRPLSIRVVDHRQQLSQWYELIQKSFSWNHAPLADISLFEAAFDILYPKGMVQFLIGSTSDGQDIAASVALLYKKTIYGWYRGFDRKYSFCLPNDQMVWHVLQWGAENGYKSFDFGGAGRPNETYGPRNFKAKFGGRLVKYGRNKYINSPYELKLSTFLYQLYRKIL